MLLASTILISPFTLLAFVWLLGVGSSIALGALEKTVSRLVAVVAEL